jgi:hypothetical protein
MNDASLDHRVVAIETELKGLHKAIADLTSAVRDIAARPQNIAWREIIITAGAIFGLLQYAGSYLEGQYAKNITPEKQRLERVEKALCLAKPEFCILPSKL